ncbi:MAG: hypothetical protein ABIO35_11065 [Nitrobacter sp.]
MTCNPEQRCVIGCAFKGYERLLKMGRDRVLALAQDAPYDVIVTGQW